MATAAQSDSVLELYSAYFNRAADATGLTFWKNSFDTFFANADSTATDAAKEIFALQKIATDMSAATEYTALYPATQTSTEFINAVYTNLLNRASDAEGLAFWSGHIDGGTLTKEQAIVNMIDGAKANTTTQGVADAALIANKNAVSKYFAETLASDDLTVAATAFTGVDDTAASVTAANAALDTAVANASAIQLTTGTDNISGTAADDTITSASGTLQGTDTVIDTSSTDADVLNIDVSVFDSSIAPTVAGIETINVTSASLPGINLSSTSGVQTLNLNTTVAGGTATVTGIAANKAANVVAGANIAKLDVSANSSGTGGNVQVDAGSATTVTLNGGAVTDTFTAKLGAGLTNLTIAGGAETDSFTLNFNGTATVGAAFSVNSDVSKLIINSQTGASVFNLATISGTTGVFPAKLTLTGDKDITFVGKAAAFPNTVTLTDGNTGTSTFKITGASAATDLSTTPFNVVDLVANLGSTPLTVDNNSTVKLSADQTTALTINTETSGLLKIDNAFASQSTTLTLGASATSLELDNSTVASVLTDLNIPTTTTSVKITGDKDLTFAKITTTAITQTIDASTFTGTLKINELTTGGIATGGSGADLIIGGTGIDTLNGGAGNDTLSTAKAAVIGTTTGVADKLTGGAGNDTFVINSSGATISDFSVADDTLQLSLTTADTGTSVSIVDGNSTTVTSTSSFFLKQVSAATTLAVSQAVIVLTGEKYADNAAVETAIEAGGTRALTFASALTANENFIVVWNKTDGTGAVVSTVDVGTTTATTVATTAASAIDLVTLTGVDAATLTAADFDFIA